MMKDIRKRWVAVLALMLLLTGIPVSANATEKTAEAQSVPYEIPNLTIRNRTNLYTGDDLAQLSTGEPMLIDGTIYLPLDMIEKLLSVPTQVDMLRNRVILGERAAISEPIGEDNIHWSAVQNEKLGLQIAVPKSWQDIAVYQTEQEIAFHEQAQHSQLVLRLWEKTAHDKNSDIGHVWTLLRWDVDEYKVRYGIDGLHGIVLGQDEHYVYTIGTPTDVQFMMEDPVSTEQYHRLEDESTEVLTRFYRDNNLQPWYPEEIVNTMGPAVQVGEYTNQLFDATGRQVHPIRYNNQIYLPIRGVCDLLGISVDWNDTRKMLTLGGRQVLSPFDPIYRENAEAYTEELMQKAEAEQNQFITDYPETAAIQGITGVVKLTDYRIDNFSYVMQYGMNTIFKYSYSFLPEDPAQIFQVGGNSLYNNNWYKTTGGWNSYLIFDQAGNVVTQYWSEFSIYNHDGFFWEELDRRLAQAWENRLVPEMVVTEDIPDIMPGDVIASDVLLRNEPRGLLSVQIGDEKDELALSYATDIEGNLYGPADYDIEGDSIYILDTHHQNVKIYSGNTLQEILPLTDVPFVTNIAVDNGVVYALGNNQTVYQVDKDKTTSLASLYSLNDMESVLDFAVQDGIVTFTVPKFGNDSVTTWTWKIGTPVTKATGIQGRWCGDGIRYHTAYVKNDDSLSAGKCSILVTYPDGSEKVVNVTASRNLAGAVVLGIDENGYMAVEVTEIWSDEEHFVRALTSLHVVDPAGNGTLRLIQPEDYKAIDNQCKWIDGKLYRMNTFETKVQIVEIPLVVE